MINITKCGKLGFESVNLWPTSKLTSLKNLSNLVKFGVTKSRIRQWNHMMVSLL